MTDKILLAHGSGGRLGHRLVDEVVLNALRNPILDRLDDAAVLTLEGRIAFTTDSYVVSPIVFPGGDIGRLAVCGTVNDLSTAGARPRYLSLSLIIEEGLPRDDLARIVASIRATAQEAGVTVVTGDTKVVERGSVDRLYINTAGVGEIPAGVEVSGHNARPGDLVLLSGSIGDHGIAVMSVREGLRFGTSVESDCAPLASLVADLVAACPGVRCLRDPTRGGLATTLNEIASQSGVRIVVEEEKIRVRDEVAAACEMLGFDPLYVANEGKLVAVVAPQDAPRALAAMRAHPYGKDAAIIGRVEAGPAGRVSMRTRLGATRLVDMLIGDLLPRIC
jgi:hydrogenase expression/formation protein HypE